MRILPKKYLRIGTPEDTDHDTPRKDRRHWATPTLMMSLFIAGVTFAIAHHVYYTRLNNTLVGSATRQQWPIRFGTAFAFLVQTCLANTTGIAYTQWVWRRCRQQAIQIGVIDAAFAVDRNIFKFFKPDYVFQFPIAAGLAVVFWCIPLSSLITPATLGVTSKPNTTLYTMSVNQPSISNFDPDTNVLYSPRSGDPTKLNQMFTVLASTGELLRLSAPESLQNISYTVDLIVPLVRCQVSDEIVRSLTAAAAYKEAISGLGDRFDTSSSTFYAQNLTFTANEIGPIGEKNNGSFRGQIGYYAMFGNTSITSEKVGVGAELWIAIANPPNGTHAYDFPAPYSASYYTCTLWNASVTTNVAFVDNVMSLQAKAIREVELSQTDDTSVSGNASSALYGLENYESFGILLYSLLTGFVMNFGGAGSYGWNWSTTVDQTILGTAKDFSEMTATWKDGGLWPDATTQDKNLTTLVEEFSLNASWSLMGMQAFNNKVLTQVNQTLWLNKYTYGPRNLFIAYGCSILACLITVLAGVYAIRANGKSYDNDFSSISRDMQSPDIAALFGPQSDNAPVLEKKVAKTNIRLIRDGKVERFRIDTENVALNTI